MSTPLASTPGVQAGVPGQKPPKPSPDFPLFAHDRGKWAKKIDGRMRYFGRWDDPQAALREYLAFIAQHEPARASQGLTLAEAANQFLTAKETAVAAGELSQRSFVEYHATCRRLVAHLGRDTPLHTLGPSDWSSFRTSRLSNLGPVAIGNEVQRVKCLGKWLYDSRLITAPIVWGPEFKKTAAKLLRKHRNESGRKLFTREQINSLLDESGLQLRAMILLGLNGGYGNTDCALLERSSVDLAAGVIDHPRPKTEIERVTPLWPETLTELRATLDRGDQQRRNVFFIGSRQWDASADLSKRFTVTARNAGIKRGGFYWLRHTFATIGAETKDQIAVNALMGHVDREISAVYRESISIDRLRAVTDHVRNWWLGSTG